MTEEVLIDIGEKGHEINYNFILLQQLAYITRANMVQDTEAYINGVNHLAALTTPYHETVQEHHKELIGLDNLFAAKLRDRRLSGAEVANLKLSYARKKFNILIKIMHFKNFLPDEGAVEIY